MVSPTSAHVHTDCTTTNPAQAANSQGIQTLLEAEKEAAKVVARARQCEFMASLWMWLPSWESIGTGCTARKSIHGEQGVHGILGVLDGRIGGQLDGGARRRAHVQASAETVAPSTTMQRQTLGIDPRDKAGT